MWLLDTATAELHYFHSPEDVPEPGYAILSHVWGNNEQSFQEVKAIGERCKLSGINPRDEVSEKIRRCCEIAEGEGFQWVWNDTCCIDKTSSAELSEAINSMFRYYALSAVCFVYLDDVTDVSDLKLVFLFRWKKRGWTLQELIAPTIVILLSRSWTPIGSKHGLADDLEEVTKIPASLLRRETHLSDYSVAQRMSWAAGRQTTRIEDEAYCLLGVFDINMPTLYGEGRHAFRRLQEEIMKNRVDTSLFSWHHFPKSSSRYHFALLAHAPSDFQDCSGVVYTPDRNEPVAFMSFTITPHGVLAQVPLLVLFDGTTFIDLSCTNNGEPIFLRVAQANKRGVYFVIGELWKSVNILPAISSRRMTNIYLASRTSDLGSSTIHRSIEFPCNGSSHAPFHFSFSLKAFNDRAHRRVHAALGVEESWKGSPPAVINLCLQNWITLVICGICTVQPVPVGTLSYVHWARVSEYDSLQSVDLLASSPDVHDCTKDHIMDWTNGKRAFRNGPRELVELSFVKSKMYPNTLILRSITWSRN